MSASDDKTSMKPSNEGKGCCMECSANASVDGKPAMKCASKGGCMEADGGCMAATSVIQRSCVPLPLPREQLQELVADARDFALLHGAGMRYRDSFNLHTLSMAPFFLLPTPFPRKHFEKVYKLQPLINKLMHKVAHDHEFLQACLKNTISVDEFTRRLWEVYTTVREEGVTQSVSLALLRCDVLLDTPVLSASTAPLPSALTQPVHCQTTHAVDLIKSPIHVGTTPVDLGNSPVDMGSSVDLINSSVPSQMVPVDLVPIVDSGTSSGTSSQMVCSSSVDKCCSPSLESVKMQSVTLSVLCCSSPKQVEVNTIASSFGALAGKMDDLHKYVLTLMGRHDLIPNLPRNTALQELCSGMLAAWDVYAESRAIILFVVEDVSYNICDQRFHEYEVLQQRPHVRVVRRTLTQIHRTGRLGLGNRLFVGDQEVGVVYFRSGYDPSGYHGEEEWQARLMIERSLAIKCPSIHYHLAGTKKVQQELAREGALLRFLSTEEARSVSELFTGLYTLDRGPEGDRTVAMAMADPDKYVMKPQREGGGNNIYGADIKTALEKLGDSKEREAYILMERIRAPIQRNYLVRPQRAAEGQGHKEGDTNEEEEEEEQEPAQLCNVISELGIFGAVLGSADEVLLNKACGHMLRSKLSSNNETGVASGNGALDSVLLVD